MKRTKCFSLLGFSVFAISLAATSCGEAQSSTIQTYRFTGEFDEGSVAQFKGMLIRNKNQPVKIIVTSTGGDARYAMDVGDAIFLHGNIRLVVDKICHSACAQYILPSADSVDIEPMASIAFHGSPTVRMLPANTPSAVREELSEIAAREEKFYNDRGVDSRKLSDFQRFRRTFCRFENSDRSENDLDRYGTASRYSVAVPSRELLLDMGYRRFSGYWPDDWEQAMANARSVGFGEKLSIVYVRTADMMRPPPARVLPVCAKELTERLVP